jgi:hypothetical protein
VIIAWCIDVETYRRASVINAHDLGLDRAREILRCKIPRTVWTRNRKPVVGNHTAVTKIARDRAGVVDAEQLGKITVAASAIDRCKRILRVGGRHGPRKADRQWNGRQQTARSGASQGL